MIHQLRPTIDLSSSPLPFFPSHRTVFFCTLIAPVSVNFSQSLPNPFGRYYRYAQRGTHGCPRVAYQCRTHTQSKPNAITRSYLYVQSGYHGPTVHSLCVFPPVFASFLITPTFLSLPPPPPLPSISLTYPSIYYYNPTPPCPTIPPAYRNQESQVPCYDRLGVSISIRGA